METLKQVGVRIHFPDSHMEQVADTAIEPYKWVTRLQMTFSNGMVFQGTGTLIGDRYVLTAAHNVLNDTYGRAKEIYVIPGQNGQVEPFHSRRAVDCFVTEEYSTTPAPFPVGNGIHDFTRFIYDYALIKLDKPVFQQNLQPVVASDEALKGKAAIIGFPTDKPFGTMWKAQNNLAEDPDNGPFLFYRISTYFGDSGAGVLKLIDGELRIVGVHVGGSEGIQSNFGVRITDEVLEQILRWMHE